MNAIPFAQSFIAYTDAALTPCLLTFEAGFVLISPHFDPFFLSWSKIVWNHKGGLAIPFLDDHK